MDHVNRARVIGGGLVGGVVIFLLMGLANHLFLDADWKVWMATMGPMLHFGGPKVSLSLWFGQSLIKGLSGAAV